MTRNLVEHPITREEVKAMITFLESVVALTHAPSNSPIGGLEEYIVGRLKRLIDQVDDDDFHRAFGVVLETGGEMLLP